MSKWGRMVIKEVEPSIYNVHIGKNDNYVRSARE